MSNGRLLSGSIISLLKEKRRIIANIQWAKLERRFKMVAGSTPGQAMINKPEGLALLTEPYTGFVEVST